MKFAELSSKEVGRRYTLLKRLQTMIDLLQVQGIAGTSVCSGDNRKALVALLELDYCAK